VTRYGLDVQASILNRENEGIFYFHYCVHSGSETHPAYYSMCTGGSFPGGKAVEAWSWQLSFTSAEEKKARSFPPPPPTSLFTAWYFVTHRQLYFVLSLHHGFQPVQLSICF